MLDKTRLEKPDDQLIILNPDISLETYNEMLDTKIDVENILSENNIFLIKNHFELLGVKSYFDFAFFSVKEFKDILNKNLNIKLFFEKIVGKENLKKGTKYSDAILLFADRIGFKRGSFEALKSDILKDLKESGIESLNEYQASTLNELKKIIKDNNRLKYFVYRKQKGGYVDMLKEDCIKLGENLGLKLLNDDEVKVKLKENFKEIDINYKDDLNKLSVLDIREIIEVNLLLRYYFLNKGKNKSDVRNPDIDKLGEDIGLKNKEIKTDEITHLKNYLAKNKIFSYSDFIGLPIYEGYRIKPHIEESRKILLEDKVCRKILKGFGMKISQDFRLDYIKKFSRYIGFTDVPNDFEYDEAKSKKLLKDVLSKKGINCTYSLKLYGIRKFKGLIKQKLIGKIAFKDINKFININFSVLISELVSKDLDEIGNLLGFETLTDKEHKEKLIEFLKAEGESIEKINARRIKTGSIFWKNPHFRYFSDKFKIKNDTVEDVVLNDIKRFSSDRLSMMKEYIQAI